MTEEVYGKLTEEQNPEGIFAVAKKPRVSTDPQNTKGTGGFLILDDLQNPQNLGTVIRTASALGISRILLGKGCADPFGKKALRASMGTIFKIHLCLSNDLCAALPLLKKSGTVYAAALDEKAKDIRTVRFLPEDHLVIGNEGRGISDAVLSLCDEKVIIPMKQNTESLNAAAAAAILMWEKQKGGGGS